jgi:hypothetical protein
LLADKAGIIHRYQGWEKQDKDIRKPSQVCDFSAFARGAGNVGPQGPVMDDTNATNGA